MKEITTLDEILEFMKLLKTNINYITKLVNSGMNTFTLTKLRSLLNFHLSGFEANYEIFLAKKIPVKYSFAALRDHYDRFHKELRSKLLIVE